MILNSPDGIGGGREAKKIVGRLVVINAIQQEVVGLLAVAVDVRTARFFGRVRSEIHAMRIDRDRTRSK